MNKSIFLAFILSSALPTVLYSQESCEEKLAFAAEMCLQKVEDAYVSLVEDELRRGVDALNASELYHYKGIEALLRSYDMRLDSTVVGLNGLLQKPIPSEQRKIIEGFLSRMKTVRNVHPSTAPDTSYYEKSIEILKEFEPSEEERSGSEKSIRERLKELRRLSEENSTQ